MYLVTVLRSSLANNITKFKHVTCNAAMFIIHVIDMLMEKDSIYHLYISENMLNHHHRRKQQPVAFQQKKDNLIVHFWGVTMVDTLLQVYTKVRLFKLR